MTIDLRRRLGTVGSRFGGLVRRLRRRWGSTPPVLVYQMGKVGSSTVARSLRAAAPPREVLHVHMLEDLDAMEALARATYPDPGETLRQIERGRAVRARIRRHPDRRWTVITLVRDPVQRNVSAFFENLTAVLPDAYERRARGDLGLPGLVEAFLDGYDHRAPLTWFQSQLEPSFGIDVFASPFPCARGWQTYESTRARLLVLRLEDLASAGAAAIGDFLGLREFELRRANVAAEKRYAEMYDEFVERARLPDDYLDRMYDSAFAQHFYTEAEIGSFRRHWSHAHG